MNGSSFSAGCKWGMGLAHQEMVKAHIEAFQIEHLIGLSRPFGNILFALWWPYMAVFVTGVGFKGRVKIPAQRTGLWFAPKRGTTGRVQ